MTDEAARGDLERRIAELEAELAHSRQALAAMAENEERFRGLVETTSDWMWEVNRDGVYTYANPKVEELLGYQPAEVIGKTPFDFMPPDASAEAIAQFRALAKDPRPFSDFENLNRHKDGRLVMLETSAVPLFDKNGAFLGYRGIDRDITRRKRAEVALAEERERLRKALDEVKTLRGILPICASCKKIRDDKGYWNQLEAYILDHSHAEFTHGICPDCYQKLYRDLQTEPGAPPVK